jgi:lysophospholipase L1-like esterase
MSGLRNSAFVCLLLFVPRLAAAPSGWIATWAASPQATDPGRGGPLAVIEDQTVRERVRVSIGADRIRVRLSNEHGTAPLRVGAVTVAAPTDLAGVRAGTVQSVTFGGRNSVTIPAGAPVLSDPVEYAVAYGAEISVSLYFPQRVTAPTRHGLALKRSVVSGRGDHTCAEKIKAVAVSESSVLLSAVLVPAPTSRRLIVAFGDSVIDGDGSTVDADRNWPGDLVRRLGKTSEGSQVAVVNGGIAGNRLLGDGYGLSALARFDRDALALPGVTHVVLLEGINDIAFPGAMLNGRLLADPADARTAEDVIGAYRQLIARAHASGVKLIGATLTPFEGADLPGYYSESKESMRQTINKWIRTSGAFDAVVDFDAVLRDPDHPGRLLPRFASEDHLHPNDAGYQAMADAIDLALFK